jgi:hypothetical protein
MLDTNGLLPIYFKNNLIYSGGLFVKSYNQSAGKYIDLDTTVGTTIKLDDDTYLYINGSIVYELNKNKSMRIIAKGYSTYYTNIVKLGKYNCISYYTQYPTKYYYLIWKEYEEEVTNGE